MSAFLSVDLTFKQFSLSWLQVLYPGSLNTEENAPSALVNQQKLEPEFHWLSLAHLPTRSLPNLGL